MILHDWTCRECGKLFEAFTSYDESSQSLAPVQCPGCGGPAQVTFLKGSFFANAHPMDRTVVFENPQTGKWSAPDRNDRPMPERLRAQGYVRREFASIRDVEAFERKHGVVNEKVSGQSDGVDVPYTRVPDHHKGV